MKLSTVLSTQPSSFTAVAFSGEFEPNVAKIAAFGYDGVELAVRDPHLLSAEEIKKVLNKVKLSVPAIGTGQAYTEEGLSLAHPDKKIREKAIERINAHIDFAAHFRAHVIIGLIRGKITDSDSRQQTFSRLVEALRLCSAAAGIKGVKLVIEAINRYETNLVNTVADGLELIQEVGAENLGMLLDTFHMNIEEPSIEDSIRSAGNHILHFHIADSNRWYPGAGHIDFGRVVEALRKVNYDGFLSAEIMPLPDSNTCAEKTMAFMRPILGKAV